MKDRASSVKVELPHTNLTSGGHILHEQMTYPGQRIQVDVKVVPRRCIADPELRLFQYTAIDEFTRLRFLASYPEQSTYSSADFLKKLVKWYARRGIRVECVQTDNGFEFTNRFSNSRKDLPTLFERTAADLGIRQSWAIWRWWEPSSTS